MLRTARLELRPISAADVSVVEAVYGDPATMTTMPWRLLRGPGAAEAWLDDRLSERLTAAHGFYAVSDRAGTLIGLCGFLPRADELEIGWAIRSPHWGHGYATEAARTVLASAGDRAVFAAIRPTNLASIRVAAKIGLSFDREDDDEYGPLVIYRNDPD